MAGVVVIVGVIVFVVSASLFNKCGFIAVLAGAVGPAAFAWAGVALVVAAALTIEEGVTLTQFLEVAAFVIGPALVGSFMIFVVVPHIRSIREERAAKDDHFVAILNLHAPAGFNGRLFKAAKPATIVDVDSRSLKLISDEGSVEVIPFADIRSWQALWRETEHVNFNAHYGTARRSSSYDNCRVEIKLPDVNRPSLSIWVSSKQDAEVMSDVLLAAINR